MLAKDIIKLAQTKWASPIGFVPEGDGVARSCLEYRKHNAVTIWDSFPIPRMDEVSTLSVMVMEQYFYTRH